MKTWERGHLGGEALSTINGRSAHAQISQLHFQHAQHLSLASMRKRAIPVSAVFRAAAKMAALPGLYYSFISLSL